MIVIIECVVSNTGIRVVNTIYCASCSQPFRLPKKQQSHTVFSSSAPNNILLFLIIFSGSWARRAQALHPGFWSRPIWWTKSSGVHSQKLILQLVDFWCIFCYHSNSVSLELHSRELELGSWIWNPMHWHDIGVIFI